MAATSHLTKQCTKTMCRMRVAALMTPLGVHGMRAPPLLMSSHARSARRDPGYVHVALPPHRCRLRRSRPRRLPPAPAPRQHQQYQAHRLSSPRGKPAEAERGAAVHQHAHTVGTGIARNTKRAPRQRACGMRARQKVYHVIPASRPTIPRVDGSALHPWRGQAGDAGASMAACWAHRSTALTCSARRRRRLQACQDDAPAHARG